MLAAGRRVAPRVRSGQLNSRMLTPLDGEPAFAEYYASPELLRYVTHLIERPIEQLSLAEFCVFSHPDDEPGHNGGWHRDAVWWDEPSGADSKARTRDRTNILNYDETLERKIWEQGQWDRRPGSARSIASKGGVGFHLALVEDDCFEVVVRDPSKPTVKMVLTVRRRAAQTTAGLAQEIPDRAGEGGYAALQWCFPWAGQAVRIDEGESACWWYSRCAEAWGDYVLGCADIAYDQHTSERQQN